MELIEVTNVDESDPIWSLVVGQARKSTMKFKIGSALVKRGRVLAVGNNSVKTHPRFGSKKDYMTMHAEGALLYNCKKLGIDPRGGTMIVYRKNGLNSKPCPSCQKLIEKAGIAKVIYTNEPGSIS